MKFDRIFVVGDSRTGTTSMHDFFKRAGIASIHYYELEAQMLPHEELNMAENEQRIVNFVRGSRFSAFSDYPTRIYYRALDREFPNAAFILTVRPSLDEWRNSMLRYFSKRKQVIDIVKLEADHLAINKMITQYFNGRDNFLLCTVGDPLLATKLIDFLGISANVKFPHSNRVDDFIPDTPPGAQT